MYVVFLWLVVIGNLFRAIPGFSAGRMVTEWVIFMNASLATALIVALPRWLPQQPSLTPDTGHPTPPATSPSLAKTWLLGLAAASLLMCTYAYLTLALYQPHLEGKPWANHSRFGPDAKWRIDPILKHGEHP
jgi:hypothetical protein